MNATLQVEQLAKLSQADFGRVAEIFQVTFQYSNPQKSIEKKWKPGNQHGNSIYCILEKAVPFESDPCNYLNTFDQLK
jgi:hypothetical protein